MGQSEGRVTGVLREIGAVLRTSIAERGTLRALARCAIVGPIYVWHRIQEIHGSMPTPVSEFDRTFGVDTDGARNNATSLRDLDIASPNWLQAGPYMPVGPDRFRRALSSLAVHHEEFTFIDFGCGKGRALLLASEFPFQRIVGVDFSHELLAIARKNWAAYRSPVRRCHEAEFVCADFLDYQLPSSPEVLFLFNPCTEPILAKLAEATRRSLQRNPRPVFILYLNPQFPHVWVNLGFQLVTADKALGYHLYANADG